MEQEIPTEAMVYRKQSLNIDVQPHDYGKLFFGDYGNFQRIDHISYEIFQKLAENNLQSRQFQRK